MTKGTRSDFGAARPSAGRPAYPETAAERRVPGAERIAALSALVESITEQLDAIEGAARRGATRRSAAAPMVDAVAEPIQPDRLGQIEAQLAAIASQMAAIHPASSSAEFGNRRRMADADDEGFIRSGSPAIEDAIAALRGDIATLARRIGSEARRSETMDKALRAEIAAQLEAVPREDSRRFEELRHHLDELRQSIASSARETTLASIEAGYSHVIERLDEITRRVPERARVDQLAGEVGRLAELIDRVQPFRAVEGDLDDIRNQIAALAAPRTDRDLEREMAGLRGAVERLAAEPRGAIALPAVEGQLAAVRREIEALAKGSDPLLLGLERQVAAVHGMMDQLSHGGGVLSRLEDRIDALSGRFDAIIDLPALQDHGGSTEAFVSAIEDLRGEIGALRSHVVEEQPRRFDHVDRQMQLLMERLDADADAGRDDGAALAQLEAQVALLAEKLVDQGPSSATLGRVEADIARLQALIGETRSEAMDAARSIARDAVSELAAQLPSQPDETLIQSLREDLRILQAAARDADGRNRDTLATVQETLTRLVDRIGRMEAERHIEADAPKSDIGAPIAPRHLGDRSEDHRPLPPGSGRPDLARRPEAVATDASRATGLTERGADRKADFIAAARRAAQAAQIEAEKADRTGPDAGFGRDLELDEGEGKTASGRLARVGNLLRRRRSVALAIAAVVLVIGAARHAGPLAEGVAPGGIASLDQTRTDSIARDRHADAEVDRATDGMPVASSAAWPDADERAVVLPGEQAASSKAPEAGASTVTAAAVPVQPMPAIPDQGSPSPVAAAAPASAQPSAPDVASAGDATVPRLDIAAVARDATAGDPNAAFALGRAYADGNGVRPDLALAAKWFSQSAEAGLAVAQYRAGSLFERGEGVERDLGQAEAWYRKASAQGNVRATHNLAVLLSDGANGAPDYVAAAKLFTVAAELGLADSQYNLGILYGRGLGVTIDLVQSYKWLALAAQQGDADAGRLRDEVANALSPEALASARAAVQAFRPRPLDAAANFEPAPRADWLRTAAMVAPLDMRQPRSSAG